MKNKMADQVTVTVEQLRSLLYRIDHVYENNDSDNYESFNQEEDRDEVTIMITKKGIEYRLNFYYSGCHVDEGSINEL